MTGAGIAGAEIIAVKMMDNIASLSEWLTKYSLKTVIPLLKGKGGELLLPIFSERSHQRDLDPIQVMLLDYSI